MHLFIQKNIKKFGAAAVALMAALALVFGEDIIAEILPNASELQMIYCELDEMRYVYTGEEIQPEIVEVALQTKNGSTVLKTSEEIEISKFIDNVEHGAASIEVLVDGYSGTLILEDVFFIHPEKTENLQVVQASELAVNISWDQVAGADGYQIYKKTADEDSYKLLCEAMFSLGTVYEDTDIAFNTTYQYKVNAYSKANKNLLKGEESEEITYYAPLTTAVFSSVERKSYNELELKWEAVEGAVGYQVLRSEQAEGELLPVGEVEDAAVLSYIDNTCECGVEYFYQIKAGQKVEDETIYGTASNVLSGKTTPEAVELFGKITKEDTEVILSWTKSEGAQGYEIYKSEGYGSEYKLVQKIENDSTFTWTDSGLRTDIDYSYKVRPYCVVKKESTTGENALEEIVVAEDSNVFLKMYVIVFDYTPEELSGNIAKITGFVGARYVWGGIVPEGWDCSGFTQWALKNCFDVTIPRVSYEQAVGGQEISLSDRSTWQAGDILAYSDGTRVTHVALYIGNGQIMHALNEKYNTVIQDVDYYEEWESSTRLVTVRRYH